MKFNLKSLLGVFFILQMLSFGQSSSSYSRIGIGDIVYSYSATGLGTGEISSSLAYPDFVSLVNPASWYRINRTRFEASLSYSGLFLSDNSTKSFLGKAQFGGFTLAFPISDSSGVGLAMGIVPYSIVNYSVLGNESNLPYSSDTYQVTYEGRGGLSKTFIGASYKLPIDLCLGASLEYYFGSMSYSSNVAFNNTTDVTTEYKRTYEPTGLGSTFGFISPDLSKLFGSKTLSNLRLGLSVNYIATLNTDTLLTSSSSIRTDTIGEGTTQMKIPARYTFGLSFALDQKYLFTLDASSQAWSQYSFNNVKSDNLRNALKVSAGFEFRPKLELGSTPWQQTIWRAGISYEQTQYNVYGVGINQYSIAGGFSYPLSYANTINFGIQYSIRGTNQLNLIKENIIQVNVGLSLGELWFVRREE